MRRWAVLGLVFPLLLSAMAPTAEACDTTAPELKGLQITPSAVETTGGAQTFTVQLHLTDPAGPDGCGGVVGFGCSLHSPNNEQRAYMIGTPTLISGDANDGVYQITFGVPQHSEAGSWRVDYFWATDEARNYARLSTAQLNALGFTSTLTVTEAQPDVTGPVLRELSFPTTVDVTSSIQYATFRARVTDDIVGFGQVSVRLSSPTRAHFATGYGLSTARVSGDAHDGVYEFLVTFPQHIEPGTWTVEYVSLTDAISNRSTDFDVASSGFQSTLEVLSSDPDTQPPVLVDLALPRTRIDCSLGAETVDVDLHLTDAGTGVQTVQVRLVSPSGQQHATAWKTFPHTGTRQDGRYRVSVVVPSCSEEGCWKVDYVMVFDYSQNWIWLTTPQLTAAGFPTDLCNGFVPGTARAEIKVPKDGRKIKGQRVTIVATLAEGLPATVQHVAFQYREESGTWADVPAANPNHSNPDQSFPYFVHWNVSALPAGTYELRAVAQDLSGGDDPSPEVTRVQIGAPDPELTEDLDPQGREHQRVKVDRDKHSRALCGGASSKERLSAVVLPPYSTLNDWLSVVSLEDSEFSSPLFAGKVVIGGLSVGLDSGQSELYSGMEAEVLISYPDSDGDGIVDGTTVREEDLVLYYYDPVKGSLTRLEGQARASTHNVARAKTRHFSTFVLMERIATGRISGRLTDAASGAPIAGVTLVTNPSGITTTTDANGDYSLVVEAGNYRVEVQHAGYYGQLSAAPEVTAAATVSLDLALVLGSITSVTPSSSSAAGGALITVVGEGFVAGSSVSVGGVSASDVQVLSPTTIVATLPAGSAGTTVKLEVRRSDGLFLQQASAITYLVAPAVVTPPGPSPSGGSLSETGSLDPVPAQSSSPPPPVLGPITSPGVGGGGGGGGGCQLGHDATASPKGLALLVVFGLLLLRRRV